MVSEDLMDQNKFSDELRDIIGPAELYERDKVPSVFRPLAQIFLEHVPIEKGAAILDVACGTGIVARLVSERVSEEGCVVGVDIEPDMIKVARDHAPPNVSSHWHVSAAEDMSFLENESFDWVVCQQGFQYFLFRFLIRGRVLF